MIENNRWILKIFNCCNRLSRSNSLQQTLRIPHMTIYGRIPGSHLRKRMRIRSAYLCYSHRSGSSADCLVIYVRMRRGYVDPVKNVDLVDPITEEKFTFLRAARMPAKSNFTYVMDRFDSPIDIHFG